MAAWLQVAAVAHWDGLSMGKLLNPDARWGKATAQVAQTWRRLHNSYVMAEFIDAILTDAAPA